MHCDIFYVNKGAYLLSVTTPLGYVLIAPLTSVATPVLRAAVRKMFGTYGQRGIDITQFSSDNDKGIIALFGDMSGMHVSQVVVGPGQHDHLAERIIRWTKEVIRASIFSLPYALSAALLNLLVTCITLVGHLQKL